MTYWHFAKDHLLLTNEVLDLISHSNFLSISSQIKATESVPDAKWPSWRVFFFFYCEFHALRKLLNNVSCFYIGLSEADIVQAVSLAVK